ncbi:hypothetical protein SacmaDRAFT_4690 [Saccharomonospora marina XMU15]|uniref:Secreted protein n=2 Tax=Saccharomonospora TaxID=1851 RepID=H5WXZ7_9PSEU|nr:hypothetical protein SacmaDRAFT_4690 [Saccharomonospora marina XMU15]
MRRLAGALFANALILTAVAAPAMAQTESNPSDAATTTVSSPESSPESPASPSIPASEESPSASPSSEPSPSSPSVPESEPSSPPDSGDETTTTTAPSPTGEPDPGVEEPPYVDDVAHGIDLDPDNGIGLLIIACAAGQPKHLESPDFEVLEGPHQDEVDGRYWLYLVQLRDGLTFKSGEVVGYWECGGESPGGGEAPGGGAPVAPVPGSDDAGEWQQENGGDAQVEFAPQGGVETGFGGTARG